MTEYIFNYSNMFGIKMMSKLIIHLNYFYHHLENGRFAPRLLLNSVYTVKLLIINTS